MLQTPWHLLKVQINLISLRGDLLTDVGYNFGELNTADLQYFLLKCWGFSVVLIDILSGFVFTKVATE